MIMRGAEGEARGNDGWGARRLDDRLYGAREEEGETRLAEVFRVPARRELTSTRSKLAPYSARRRTGSPRRSTGREELGRAQGGRGAPCEIPRRGCRDPVNIAVAQSGGE